MKWLTLLAIGVLAVLVAIYLTQGYQFHAVELVQPTEYLATVCVYVNGELIECTSNVLTNIGKEFVEDQLVSPQTANYTKWISVSNSTTDCVATDTVLPGELNVAGLTRAECTITDVGTGAWSCEKTFTATASVPNVRQGGYNWNSTATSSGNLLACATFTSVNLEANDQILVRWNVTIS